ncbi:MAG: hypothetical protein K1X64_16225 [Myxococcaceae bacterium]|nr:hypothetical protein [Myxococcaceae bacterium]
MRSISFVFGLFLLSCGATPPVATTGSVKLKFAVTDGVRNNPALKDPLIGTVYGAIYLSEDVGITGPRTNSTAAADIPATAVDVRTAMASEAEVVIEGLAAGQYTILGYFDLDNNPGNPSRPDSGDPAAYPRTNLFEIKAGEQTKRTFVFDFIYN